MESREQAKSHSISKELDQNMNNTVTSMEECKSSQYDEVSKQEIQIDSCEEKSQNVSECIVTTSETEDQRNGTDENKTQLDNSVNIDKWGGDQELIETKSEEVLDDSDDDGQSVEYNKEHEMEINTTRKKQFVSAAVSSLPKISMILATELLSDSHLSSNNVECQNGSASLLPSGSFKSSPEVFTTHRSFTSSKIKGKQRRRGSAWTDEETDFLMEVWARQTEIMKQKGCDDSVTCAPVYRLISRQMTEQGYDKSWEQCKTRIHTLKRAYKITKDEIDNGEQTITYCRHFDKLEIISGDNAQITPGMLAAGLEQERNQRDVKERGKKQPVKRKLVVGENPNLVKRNNNGNPVIPSTGIIPKLLAQAPTLSMSGNSGQPQNTSSSGMTWYPPQPLQLQHQQHEQQSNTPQQQQQSFLSPAVQATPPPQPTNTLTSTMQTSPTYSYQPSTSKTSPLPPYSSSVVNSQTRILVKCESSHIGTLNQYSTVSSSTNWHNSHTNVLQCGTTTGSVSSGGNDLERMRLDLEMRKLEVESNKLEMEERQRREDRDHQYRMMQLLLFGLGQQNSQSPGQWSDIAANHYSTDLLRALENGLVPGGVQKVNEKGLSFSEL